MDLPLNVPTNCATRPPSPFTPYGIIVGSLPSAITSFSACVVTDTSSALIAGLVATDCHVDLPVV